MEIFDRIKYDGPQDSSQWLIYKYPSEQFVLGSQLIVNQGQEVLFFKGGEALDLFGPGTHTLSTGNLPILNKLVNYPFGGKTPFTAEVYFINKTVNLNMKWGTSTPIPLEDPKYGLILNVGARGQYGIFINDSRRFVVRSIGAILNGCTVNPLLIPRYFNGVINSKIKSVTAEYMIKKKISFLEISLYLSELSDLFKEKLDIEFERFGIELTNFYCISITPKPGETEKFQDYKEDIALGTDFYRQRRSFDIFEKMVENGFVEQFGKAFTSIDQTIESSQFSNQREEIMRCPHCNVEIPLGMKYCGNCGRKL